MFGIGYDLMKRLSTLQHVHPVVKQCGFANYCQRKYDVEILKIFEMLDCKSMDTNLKLLSGEPLELVDVTQ